MPRGDGTGPTGAGPVTGRRGGYCAGYGDPSAGRQPSVGNGGPGGGRCFGRGNRLDSAGGPFRGAFGPRTGAAAPPGGSPLDRETEIAVLKADAADLEEKLRLINERPAGLSEEKRERPR